jgi:hypothetical protein
MQQAWKKMGRQIILESLKQVESSKDKGVSEKTNIKADLYSNKLCRCDKLSIRSKSRIL